MLTRPSKVACPQKPIPCKTALILILAALPMLAPFSGCAGVGSASKTQTPPPQTYSIAGIVTPASGGSGTTLLLSGSAVASTPADALGNYSFHSLPNGAYTITASHTGYIFTPSSQSVTVNGADVTAVNFAAATQMPQTFSLAGSISPAALAAGSAVTLTGTASASSIADASGNYSFSGLSNGNYTV